MTTNAQIAAWAKGFDAKLASIETGVKTLLAIHADVGPAPPPSTEPPATEPPVIEPPPIIPTPGTARTAADLIASRIVPPYNARNVRGNHPPAQVATFKPGVWPGMADMGGTGERDEIGPVTAQVADWLMGWSSANMIEWAKSHTALPVHYRIAGQRVDFTDHPRASSYDGNEVGANPLITIPSPYRMNSAHYPGCVFVPYLATGDAAHLEELKDACTYHLMYMNPDYRGEAKGFIEKGEVRGYAWTLRDFATLCMVTDEPYWKTILANNCAEFNRMWVKSADPINKLGFITNEYVPGTDGSKCTSPWQQDFLCFILGWMIWSGKFPEWRENYEWSCRNMLMRAHGTGGFPKTRAIGYWWNTGNVTDGASLARANQRDMVPPADGKLMVTDQSYGAYFRGALKMAALNGIAGAQAGFDWVDPQILWVPPKLAV